MNIFGDEIIVSVYKEYNHLVVITVTREEAKKLSTPKYEAIAEEINKYPQKLINRIKNKFELDDSTKGVYWLLVRLRQTENHGIKKMREKILDSREQNILWRHDVGQRSGERYILEFLETGNKQRTGHIL
jgi:hypothetical protein